MGVGRPGNLDVSVEGDILTITIDLNRELGLSRSKKNIIISTTSGNMKIKEREGYYLGVNLYKNGSRVTPHFRNKEIKEKPRVKRRTTV